MENTQDTTTNEYYNGYAIKTTAAELENEAAYYFDIITEHSISINNNITDNWLENNTAVQDVIAHAPITITLSGSVSELVYVPSTNNSRFLGKFYNLLNTKNGQVRDRLVTNKLSAIGQLFPPVDNLTQLAKNAVVYVEDSVDRYLKIYKNIKKNMNDETRLQEIYRKLADLSDQNVEMFVTTPFGGFDHMYIQNLKFTQGNENHIGNISMTLKRLYFTDVQYADADKSVLEKYNKYAQSMIENYGKADGVMSGDSSLYNWFGKPFGLTYKTYGN